MCGVAAGVADHQKSSSFNECTDVHLAHVCDEFAMCTVLNFSLLEVVRF